MIDVVLIEGDGVRRASEYETPVVVTLGDVSTILPIDVTYAGNEPLQLRQITKVNTRSKKCNTEDQTHVALYVTRPSKILLPVI